MKTGFKRRERDVTVTDRQRDRKRERERDVTDTQFRLGAKSSSDAGERYQRQLTL